MTKEKKRDDQKKTPIESVVEPSGDEFQQGGAVSLSSLKAMRFIEVFIKKRRGALKKLADFDNGNGPSEH
ncbi:hypothetical protein A2870_04395 [Candidatus Curtissbacteria bacterium RIFCSPHIGHO2_01_FULL_41_11]|uniref:Uncharacterized protein n=1 Tax=Candidatus Curtissbacteria bacterium RIFCSPHIGHO2_01_FULL_41_11 TaxID=1797711 RepID=A0A1F5G535_9BACT|nr:MAG: hypothetical protein A2870_04395 [Candidatus Curtissbacteria bacterium RIFCSPHIGHO2_01_FULL_41_11]